MKKVEKNKVKHGVIFFKLLTEFKIIHLHFFVKYQTLKSNYTLQRQMHLCNNDRCNRIDSKIVNLMSTKKTKIKFEVESELKKHSLFTQLYVCILVSFVGIQCCPE